MTSLTPISNIAVTDNRNKQRKVLTTTSREPSLYSKTLYRKPLTLYVAYRTVTNGERRLGGGLIMLKKLSLENADDTKSGRNGKRMKC